MLIAVKTPEIKTDTRSFLGIWKKRAGHYPRNGRQLVFKMRQRGNGHLVKREKNDDVDIIKATSKCFYMTKEDKVTRSCRIASSVFDRCNPTQHDQIILITAFNELIENLNERNTHLLGERSVNMTLFMDENSDRSH